MECLFGITGKDFCLLAADCVAARSIVVMKSSEDKFRALNDTSILLYSGEPGDTVQFAEYIQCNVQLHEMKHGLPLSLPAAASFTRKELANALRSRHPYQVNMLIGGYNRAEKKPELYWIDYLAAMANVPFAAQGYGSYFCLSLMDRHWKAGMNLDEAKSLLQRCLDELKTRFIVNLPKFTVVVVDANGWRQIDF